MASVAHNQAQRLALASTDRARAEYASRRPTSWPRSSTAPRGDAAKAAGVSEKALRRRIERGTVASEVRDGRRLVLVESVRDDPAPPRRGVDVAPLLVRLEQLATDNGRLRPLTEVAESTERRLAAELVEQRARVAELVAREAELAAAGPIRAWRLARARRPPAG